MRWKQPICGKQAIQFIFTFMDASAGTVVQGCDQGDCIAGRTVSFKGKVLSAEL